MNILFVHQNFPGQFRLLAPALVKRGHKVIAMTLQAAELGEWQGVLVVPSRLSQRQTEGIHRWAAKFEREVIRAEACYTTARQLRDTGFNPDVIVAHAAWGEALLLKDVWPQAKLGLYCELFYRATGSDVDFDPEFPANDEHLAAGIRLSHASDYLQFVAADGGLCPTQWQANTFPERFRERITVVHEGIDTHYSSPSESVTIKLDGGLTLSPGDEVVTFAARNLEPHRGYHTFVRSLPSLLARRRDVRVLIVGGDEKGYGPEPSEGSWKELFIQEIAHQVSEESWSRVHFLGTLPHDQFTAVLQVSSVHVYLTYPFVLSWSLLEAMSVGCAIVASDTAPVREVLSDGITGTLVDFFDAPALATKITELLANPALRRRYGIAARAHAIAHFDADNVCLPEQITWTEGLQHQ